VKASYRRSQHARGQIGVRALLRPTVPRWATRTPGRSAVSSDQPDLPALGYSACNDSKAWTQASVGEGLRVVPEVVVSGRVHFFAIEPEGAGQVEQFVEQVGRFDLSSAVEIEEREQEHGCVEIGRAVSAGVAANRSFEASGGDVGGDGVALGQPSADLSCWRAVGGAMRKARSRASQAMGLECT